MTKNKSLSDGHYSEWKDPPEGTSHRNTLIEYTTLDALHTWKIYVRALSLSRYCSGCFRKNSYAECW